MPGINSTTASRYESGWEMEYDHYQHYFYDDHDPDEDFSKSTAPSEDIWKKFELVPTPPMSPIRTLEGAAGVGMVCPSLGDKLEWVSQFLGQEDDQDVPCKLSSADEALGNLSSIIVQDCMWSGFSAGKQLEKVFGERLASCPNKLPMQAMGAAITTTGRAQCVTVPVDAAVPVLGSLATDCMDPAAVLAFPLTGGTFKKPSVSSWSGTHTDSSDDESSDHDDDDDDDDDDEEEIDVVTVEHKQYKSRRLVNSRVTGGHGGGLNRRTPVTIMVRADALNPCMKRFHISIHQQHHNYAAPSPDTHTAPALPGHTAPALPRKRVRHEPSNSSHNFSSTQPHLHPASTSNQNSESKPHVAVATIGSESSDANTPSPCGSPSACPRLSSCHPCSPQSSDYEDTDKRKTHNFLERKRRNDLRSRFLALRDEVPGLAECPKTPKVAILTRATEYLGQLHSSERQRAQEKRQLKARQQQLLRRLAQLKQRP